MSAARASPIQRRGRTTGAVRGAKRGLSAIGSSTSKLGDEYAGVHQQPDAEQASDADRRIKERSHSPFARLPDHEPERDNNRQQQNGELRSPGREQRAGEAWPFLDLFEHGREGARVERRQPWRGCVVLVSGRPIRRWGGSSAGVGRECRVVEGGVQRDADEKQAEHDEDEKRRNMPQPALQIGKRDRQKQREDKNEAIAEVGHETLHRSEIEGREDVADQEEVERAKERPEYCRTAARKAGAAEHQRRHG